ncbi:hypothetical protein ACFWPJ_32590, partial [Nocardia sp. NPDC058497]
PDPSNTLDPSPPPSLRRIGELAVTDLSRELGTRELWSGPERVEAARRLLRAYRRHTADLAIVEDLLRATPTWVLVGEHDAFAAPGVVNEFTERVWAEQETIPGARHDLACAHPVAVADVVVDAVQVARESARYRTR